MTVGLERMGFVEDEIIGFLGGNLVRVLETVCTGEAGRASPAVGETSGPSRWLGGENARQAGRR